jgi:hypothetical protein
VVKLSKKNSQSDVTLVSLDDVSGVEKLPRVTQICDLYVLEMPNQLDTCHCQLCHVSLMTWSAT